MFFDEYAQNRIAINVNKSSYNSNYLRTLVVWDKSNQKKIDKEIKEETKKQKKETLYV